MHNLFMMELPSGKCIQMCFTSPQPTTPGKDASLQMCLNVFAQDYLGKTVPEK